MPYSIQRKAAKRVMQNLVDGTTRAGGHAASHALSGMLCFRASDTLTTVGGCRSLPKCARSTRRSRRRSASRSIQMQSHVASKQPMHKCLFVSNKTCMQAEEATSEAMAAGKEAHGNMQTRLHAMQALLGAC